MLILTQNFSIKKIIKIVLKFCYIPLILALVGGFLSRNYAQSGYAPIYTAKSTVIVKPKHEKSRYLMQQVDGELHLVPTYQDFISSNKVLKVAQNNLEKIDAYNGSIASLQKKTVVDTKDNSLILSIQLSDHSKSLAVKQANAVATAFKQQISTISSTSQVKFITKATNKNISTSTFSGKKALLYGVILGGVVGIFIELIIGGLLVRKDQTN